VQAKRENAASSEKSCIDIVSPLTVNTCVCIPPCVLLKTILKQVITLLCVLGNPVPFLLACAFANKLDAFAMSAGGNHNIIVTSEELYIGDSRTSESGSSAVPRSCPPDDDDASSCNADLLLPHSVPVINVTPAPLRGYASAASALPRKMCGPTHDSFQASLLAERQRNGFVVDYVIHTQEGVGGPHSIEVQLSNVSLYWPYLLDMKFVWDVIEVYSHFAFVDWVMRNPPPSAPQRWMFVNVLLSRGQLLLVSPVQATLGQGILPVQTWQPALALRWDLLRVGYDWGGDKESVLLVNLCSLSACIVKRLNTSLISRHWNHQSGLYIEHKYFLKPVNGQIRWYAHKPPKNSAGAHSNAAPQARAAGFTSSMTGSVLSTFSRNAASVTVHRNALGLAPSDDDDGHECTTVHEHELTVSLDAVKLQPVLSDRWHFQSLLDVARQLGSRGSQPHSTQGWEKDGEPLAPEPSTSSESAGARDEVPTSAVLHMDHSQLSTFSCQKVANSAGQPADDRLPSSTSYVPLDWESGVGASSTWTVQEQDAVSPELRSSNTIGALASAKTVARLAAQTTENIAWAKQALTGCKPSGKGRRLIAPVPVNSFSANVAAAAKHSGSLTLPAPWCAPLIMWTVW
jgi:hypothetical protein